MLRTVLCSPALLYKCTVYFLDDCSSVSDLDVDSNGPADPGWESGLGIRIQAGQVVSEKKEKRKIIHV
jgi:hypothetical protein